MTTITKGKNNGVCRMCDKEKKLHCKGFCVDCYNEIGRRLKELKEEYPHAPRSSLRIYPEVYRQWVGVFKGLGTDDLEDDEVMMVFITEFERYKEETERLRNENGILQKRLDTTKAEAKAILSAKIDETGVLDGEIPDDRNNELEKENKELRDVAQGLEDTIQGLEDTIQELKNELSAMNEHNLDEPEPEPDTIEPDNDWEVDTLEESDEESDDWSTKW